MPNCRILIESKDIEKILKSDYFDNIPKRYLKKNEICFPNSERILIIKKGKIKVTYYNNEKEITLYYLCKNNMAYCNQNNIIKAKENSEFYFLKADEYYELFKDPNFCNLLLNSLTKNINIERELIFDLAFKTCSQRAIEFLTSAAIAAGEKTPKGLKINLNCTIDEFATFLGTSRQTLSMFLNMLIKNNIMEKKGQKTFFIKDIKALRNFKF
ncbi:Crp/Fnr family transcriptional regulator [Lebetimonas sp. JS032]|uniref:Crp/Fnr family transcriptional regulator n=1 Tax=Lebetimonas sp. JS032 TaxID=990070 RepID=UPI000466C6F4|nr:helix-turn-helix domain-containing protein [Lebetimonas sp. JS032]